jgi:hypothetical protein
VSTKSQLTTCLAGMALLHGASARGVNESAREIPLAYDVDVLVVGGTTRGVAAAVAAAESGAKVFLAARKPYLGIDMCATNRLWLEEGEVPETDLEKAMFETADVPVKPGLPFTYTANRKPNKVHPDPKGTVLTDGKARDAARESVQYDGDVTIIADLGEQVDLNGLAVSYFTRPGEFGVSRMEFSLSPDGEIWPEIGSVDGKLEGERAETVEHKFAASARYVKVDVTMHPGCERVLLGELSIFGDGKKGEIEPAVKIARPMQVKKALDEALLAKRIQFLYGSYPADVLIDADGKLAGITMVNRSGRQAVRAKVIIDATHRGVVARMTDAKFAEFPAGTQSFKRIVVGGEAGAEAKDIGLKFTVPPDGTGKPVGKHQEHPVYEYTLDIHMPDSSWASYAKADEIARGISWQKGQLAGSEMLFQVPPDPVKGKASQKEWTGVGELNIDALRPDGVERIFVLGGAADVSREVAAKILRPLDGMRLGARVGAVAAKEAQAIELPPLEETKVAGEGGVPSAIGEVGEMLQGVRSRPLEGQRFVASPLRNLPVLGNYDVVVVGGGTGGGPAGIGAARGGAKTLVIEYLNGLGGVGTLGRISLYYHGNRVGFTSEVDRGVGATRGWNIERKMEWLRSELVKAGGEIWFGTLGAGSVLDGDRFIGVVVATPHGRGVVLANTVIDATGNAVIPACAGVETQEIGGDHISVQGTGLPPMTPGQSYLNSDWTFCDDDDVLDMWRMFVVGKQKYENVYDMGQLIDTRARRRIVGEVVISPMDVYNRRTFPDTITQAASNFDNHGFSSHPMFMLFNPGKKGQWCDVPYRALLPKGHDGMLVIGLGMSAHGDAMPVLRMQPDVQNQGYAAGRAGAMAAVGKTTVRKIDIKRLQKHLVDVKILPAKVLADKDSFPLPEEKIAAAVATLNEGYAGIPVLMSSVEVALPMLREGYAKAADGEAKLRFAHVLGMLHDGTGAETLAKAIAAAEWDKGWNFKGMGQYGPSSSMLDNLIVALGRTKDERAIPVIIEKVRQLDEKSEFSHSRAVAMALEQFKTPKAAPALAEMLRRKGVMGHAFESIEESIERAPASKVDTSTRNSSLRELILARALFRCGDHEGLGEKILREYSADLRGHYVTHARAVLAGK